MTHLERIRRTFRFEPIDRPAVDLMEGHIWEELKSYLRDRFGLTETSEMIELLDPDSRWVGLEYVGPPAPPPPKDQPLQIPTTVTKDVRSGPLSGARTVAEVEAYRRPDPSWLQPKDYAALRAKWPHHALILCPGWSPLFWGACEAFGLEEALIKAHSEPGLFEAFVQTQHEWYMRFLAPAVRAAAGHCDVCWLGDDYAGQKTMLLSPELWRRSIKPRLAEQVRVIRENGMYAMLHSCGSVGPILGDLIDIGVNALLVFQTTAEGMDPESVAREFGGRMVFYGGMDVQRLLSYGARTEIEAAIRRNVAAFRECGGYVVSNSHHGVATINGDNIVAMFDIAKEMTL